VGYFYLCTYNHLRPHRWDGRLRRRPSRIQDLETASLFLFSRRRRRAASWVARVNAIRGDSFCSLGNWTYRHPSFPMSFLCSAKSITSAADQFSSRTFTPLLPPSSISSISSSSRLDSDFQPKKFSRMQIKILQNQVIVKMVLAVHNFFC